MRLIISAVLIAISIDACRALCLRDGYDFGGKMADKHCVCMSDMGTLNDFIYRRVHLGTSYPEANSNPVKHERRYEYHAPGYLDGHSDLDD